MLMRLSRFQCIIPSRIFYRHIYGAVNTKKEGRHQVKPVFAYEKFDMRHIGPRPANIDKMLSVIGMANMHEFIKSAIHDVLQQYYRGVAMNLTDEVSETQILTISKEYSEMNRIRRSFIGQGYYGTITPSVIKRSILENPAWYTPYTPYQAEISQGRLESLLNFQTMVCELTGLPLANASLLDEGTAAAEAMDLLYEASTEDHRNIILVDENCFPQTLACMKTRAGPLGIEIKTVSRENILYLSERDCESVFGVFIQYPDNLGSIVRIEETITNVKSLGLKIACATDLLALTFLKSPGDLGVDVAIGSTQRLGVPMGYGGPHAAFFACKEEHQRKIPGRIVGISKDVEGDRALRLALQTREQHIRRDKATSNICTAQALLANMAVMYAIYHGPEGLSKMAQRIHKQALFVAHAAQCLGHALVSNEFFDTIAITLRDGVVSEQVYEHAKEEHNSLIRIVDEKTITITLDEVTSDKDVDTILSILNLERTEGAFVVGSVDGCNNGGGFGISETMLRDVHSFMKQPVFNSYHSETELMRYIHELECKDMSLIHSMIPLGSCTMKLNAATEMKAMNFSGWSNLHPFAPVEDSQGYSLLMTELKSFLSTLTGFDAISLMPNSGAQGEYAGLSVIQAYHKSKGDTLRDICLIPVSAHGTNPATASMCGMTVIPVKCHQQGNIDIQDLSKQILKYSERILCSMITFPSTFGLFDSGIRNVISMVHKVGGLVYMDGANMNALMGRIRPGDLGADVCHLNLHKTFCIPHGGGGPGVGPIGVTKILAPFLPSHPLVKIPGSTEFSIGPVSSAPFGSASILPISWAYIRMMGLKGLLKCSEVALLSANYMMFKLKGHYKILFSDELCAHEFLIDCRPFEESCGIEVSDIAKRLQDYSIHSPTMSWPVPGTLMVEPTESEDIRELDRFIEAMISIRQEISEIEAGEMPCNNNLLKNAPHPIKSIVKGKWDRPYSMERAVYPVESLKKRKFWPTVSRLNEVYGDQNFTCSLCN